MKVKAIKSFIGKISMNINDEREIIDKKLAEELIRAGHVIEVKATNNLVAEPVKKVEKKETKKNNRKKK